MARIAVLIAPDRLTAEVQVGNGSAATPSDLQQAIAQAGVVHGLDAAAIAELGPRLHDPAFTARIVTGTGNVEGAVAGSGKYTVRYGFLPWLKAVLGL